MLKTKLDLEGTCLGLKVEKPCWSWGLISQSTYSVQLILQNQKVSLLKNMLDNKHCKNISYVSLLSQKFSP